LIVVRPVLLLPDATMISRSLATVRGDLRACCLQWCGSQRVLLRFHGQSQHSSQTRKPMAGTLRHSHCSVKSSALAGHCQPAYRVGQ
jgi:hypothetical protein